MADTSPVRRRSVTIAVLSIAGHLVEAGEDTARTEADTVEVDTVAVATVAVDTVEVDTVAVAVNTAVAATVAVGDTVVVVASLKGPAAPIVWELATRVYPPLWGADASLAGVHATTRGHSGLRAALELGRRPDRQIFSSRSIDAVALSPSRLCADAVRPG